MAACIATWSFGLQAVKSAKQALLDGNSALSATEKGINDVEEDVSTGCYLVGRGGLPNCEGVLECDGAIMTGEGPGFGAVAALQGICCPIKVARKVMEESRHSILVGSGAQQFAVKHGFAVESREELLGKESLQKYEDYKAGRTAGEKGHDTLGLITLDRNGKLVAGVSTSGMPFKEAGRVGDSPLPGPGLFVDARHGAAAATGDGDHIVLFSPCSRVVALLGEGATPAAACRRVVADMAAVWGNRTPRLEVAVIAMGTKGEVGAASTVTSWTDLRLGRVYPGFPYAVWQEKQCPEETVLTALPVMGGEGGECAGTAQG